jgi:hypothetical protein
MSRKLPEPEPEEFRPNPSRQHPPDRKVQLPEQVRHAAAVADAQVTGRSVARPPQPNRTVPYTDAEIDAALQQLERGDVKVTGPASDTIIGLAREGARLIRAHRGGAREPREKSDSVTRRLAALLQAYRELSPHLQKRPTRDDDNPLPA